MPRGNNHCRRERAENGGMYMKRIVLPLLLFAALIWLVPLAGFLLGDAFAPGSAQSGTPASPAPQATAQPGSGGLLPQNNTGEEPLLIYNEATGEVDTVSIFDYVVGAVAAEMPMSYSDEALKAQAVAAHSYALARKALAQQTQTSAPMGAYFSANPSSRLGYVTDDVMKQMWGDAYAENRARLVGLVQPVLGEVLTYDGQPALACYHAISNGATQASEAVWGTALPYLVSVESLFDLSSPEYEQSLSLSSLEVSQLLSQTIMGLDFSGDPSGWFAQMDRTPQGYVTKVHFGQASCNAADVRTALGLRSTDFTVSYDAATDTFTFTTKGYGHGVGMSQYGAHAMALTGKTYREILAWYYPGTSLSSAV